MLTIKQYQTNLNFLNYNCGTPDGIRGTKTIQGIKEFQKTYGLVVDGIYGEKTNAKLIEVIKDIQNKINCTMIDGIVGNETINQCKTYQLSHNLQVDRNMRKSNNIKSI